jgi:predicted transglutaminase-like cysteine proteinase
MYRLRSVFLKTTAAMMAIVAVCVAVPSWAAPEASFPKAPSSVDYMPVGGPVAAPTGYLELCARSPIDCRQSPHDGLDLIAAGARTALIEKRQSQIRTAKVDGRGTPVQVAPAAPVVVALSDSVHSAAYVRVNLDEPTMTMVIALNDRVNHAIRAETDQEIYHVADYWTAPGVGPGARGDCEDFALEKRRLLIDSGIPAEALSIAIVRTPAGEVHAVLVLSARQGDYILDNLHGEVKAWQLTGYSWISRQAPGNDLGWVSLIPANPLHMQTVGAN